MLVLNVQGRPLAAKRDPRSHLSVNGVLVRLRPTPDTSSRVVLPLRTSGLSQQLLIVALPQKGYKHGYRSARN